jgi:hypothetical protein
MSSRRTTISSTCSRWVPSTPDAGHLALYLARGVSISKDVQISCTSCREEHPNPVTISLHDEAEISGSKGTANFVWRCGNCKVRLAPCPAENVYSDFNLYLLIMSASCSEPRLYLLQS